MTSNNDKWTQPYHEISYLRVKWPMHVSIQPLDDGILLTYINLSIPNPFSNTQEWIFTNKKYKNPIVAAKRFAEKRFYNQP